MRQFKINNQLCNIPESWEEVTLEQLLKLNTGITRSLELISVFTIPEKELSNIKDLKLIEEIEITLSFFANVTGRDQMFEKINDKPTKFVFKGVEVPLPSDIGDSSIGQYQDMKFEVSEYMKEDGEEIDLIRRLSIYPKIISIYLQPIVTDTEYDWRKAEEISKELYNCSALEVARWGNFFIQRFLELRSGILRDVERLDTVQKNQKQGFLKSLKSSVGRLFCTISREATLKDRLT
jgi:hypothetical protein